MELEKELKYYESIKDELLKHHEGKFALIKGDKLINTFTKMEEAYEDGVKNFGTEPCLSLRGIAEAISFNTLGINSAISSLWLCGER